MAETNKAQSAQAALPLTETPEFMEAVQRTVKAQMETLLGALPSGDGKNDGFSANALALALAELSGQGQGKTFVDPKVLKLRQQARDKMWELIGAAHAEKRKATYQLCAKTVLDDQLIDPMWLDPSDRIAKPTVIDWAGAPNEAMVPINDTARAIHEQFKLSIGSSGAPAPGKPMGITPGGLVVYGAAVPKRRGDLGRNPQFGENVTDQFEREQGSVSIHHKSAPGQQRPVNVLGTIAAPPQEIGNAIHPGR